MYREHESYLQQGQKGQELIRHGRLFFRAGILFSCRHRKTSLILGAKIKEVWYTYRCQLWSISHFLVWSSLLAQAGLFLLFVVILLQQSGQFIIIGHQVFRDQDYQQRIVPVQQ